MIQRIKTDYASASTLVEVTPDDLIVIARRMHIEATKAVPGEEILVQVTERITFKYNPGITTAGFTGRNPTNKSLAGTEVSSRMDTAMNDLVFQEDAATQPSTH